MGDWDFLGEEPPKQIGQRFRELIIGGASNKEALEVIRSEFPKSKAKLTDAAWNRHELKVNADCYDDRGFRIKQRPRPKKKKKKKVVDPPLEDFL